MNKRKHYRINHVIYCDMDGVLADFNGATEALSRFKTEKGFFENLQPFEKNIRAIKRLLADGNRVYILSASPNEQADGDKKRWLKKYLPRLPKKNIIIMRLGENKARYASADGNILFDDYGKNIHEWVAADGIGWKIRGDGDIENALEIISMTF